MRAISSVIRGDLYVKILNCAPEVRMDVIDKDGKVFSNMHSRVVPLVKFGKKPDGDWKEIKFTNGLLEGYRGYFKTYIYLPKGKGK